jgi:CelD/BcsL family acetyltransferase involved in cellulose biosynthesis
MATQQNSLSGAPASTALRVSVVEPRQDPRWDAFVTAHPQGLIYQHSSWLDSLRAEYRQPQITLLCEDADGQVRGVLPLLLTRGLPLKKHDELLGARLSSLPRTPLGGPLASDGAATSALLQAAVALVQRGDAPRLQIKRAARDLDGLAGLQAVTWRDSYVRELPDDPEQLRFGNARNHSRVRWSINKALKAGVVVREAATEEDLKRWYGVYLAMMRTIPVPPRPYRFFSALWRNLRPLGFMQLLLAEVPDAGRSRLVAGSVFLRFGREVSYAFSGARPADLPLRAQDVIQWTALRAACADGFRSYDFGEVSAGDSGLAEFKHKWGSEPVQLYRYYFPAVQATDAQDSSGGPSPAHRAWNRLPLPATAVAGDLNYRYH